MRPIAGLGGIIPPRAWGQLVEAGHTKLYQRGETLLLQGERVPYVLVLVNGQVKVSRLDANWTQLVLAIRGPGEVLGELAVLDGSPPSATVTATTVCETRKVLASRFRELVTELELEDELLRHMVGRFKETEKLRAELSVLPGAGARVVHGLCYLVACLLRETAPASGRIDIRLSHEELGTVVGLSRSTVSTELGKLSELGVIRTGRNRVVVRDLEHLSALDHAR